MSGEVCMAVRLIESLATTEPLADLFSDQSVLRAMLDFEVALARAQAHLKIVPRSAAKAIAAAAKVEAFDAAALTGAALRAGTPIIPFVKALTEHVRAIDSTAAGFVHWGATSQDVADTALVLLLKRAQVYPGVRSHASGRWVGTAGYGTSGRGDAWANAYAARVSDHVWAQSCRLARRDQPQSQTH